MLTGQFMRRIIRSANTKEFRLCNFKKIWYDMSKYAIKDARMKVNLHTHTARCGHASGTDEEYVLAAIEAGFDTLGFSDHTPFPYSSGFSCRCAAMIMDELENYITSVRLLQEKYQDKIKILLGLECEPIPRFMSFLTELRPRLDYMILGNHGDREFEKYSGNLTTPEELWHYLEVTLSGMESGLFLYVAHPDLLLHRYPEFDEDARKISIILCREARRLNLPLEYNLTGLKNGPPEGGLGYPYHGFWEIAAQENVTAVVGVDAHQPQWLLDADINGAHKYLQELGIPVLDNPLALMQSR